jgi:hypothetical protein
MSPAAFIRHGRHGASGRARARLVVVGDDALALGPRGPLLACLRARAGHVVLAPSACPYSLVARWQRVGFGRIVDPASVARLLHEHLPCRPPDLAVRHWLGQEPSPTGALSRAVLVLPLLSPLTVGAWRAGLDWSRRALQDACREADLSPSAVLDAYRGAVVAWARAEGLTVEAIAEILGCARETIHRRQRRPRRA